MSLNLYKDCINIGFLDISHSYSTRFSIILFLMALLGKEAVLGSKYKLSLNVSAADFLPVKTRFGLPVL